MKLYRIQARCKNLYFDKILEAKDDTTALESFANGVESGEIVGSDEGFYGDRVHVTFEEVDRNVSTGTSGEKASVGVEVGIPGVKTG